MDFTPAEHEVNVVQGPDPGKGFADPLHLEDDFRLQAKPSLLVAYKSTAVRLTGGDPEPHCLNHVRKLPCDYTFTRIGIDPVFFDMFIGDRVRVQDYLFLIDDAFGDFAAFDPLINLAGLAWITLYISVPVTGLYVPEGKTVKVKTDNLDLTLLPMADPGRLEGLDSSLRHTVVLGIDHVKIFSCGNRGFNHFAGFLKTPGVAARSIPHNIEFTFFRSLEHRGAAPNLRRAPQLPANEDEIDRFRNIF